jgi:hypothetical protein
MATKKAAPKAAAGTTSRASASEAPEGTEAKYHKTASGRMVRYVKDGPERVKVFVRRFDQFTGEPLEKDDEYPVDIASLTEQRNAHLAEAARLKEEIDEAKNAEEPEIPEDEQTDGTPR